jgi:hypothetical protein
MWQAAPEKWLSTSVANPKKRGSVIYQPRIIHKITRLRKTVV